MKSTTGMSARMMWHIGQGVSIKIWSGLAKTISEGAAGELA
jgi:hypothetical protein